MNCHSLHQICQPSLIRVIVGEIRLFEKLNKNMITVVAVKLDDSENLVWVVRNMGGRSFQSTSGTEADTS
jgi:hypothetical protein